MLLSPFCPYVRLDAHRLGRARRRLRPLPLRSSLRVGRHAVSAQPTQPGPVARRGCAVASAWPAAASARDSLRDSPARRPWRPSLRAVSPPLPVHSPTSESPSAAYPQPTSRTCLGTAAQRALGVRAPLWRASPARAHHVPCGLPLLAPVRAPAMPTTKKKPLCNRLCVRACMAACGARFTKPFSLQKSLPTGNGLPSVNW
jgi:hypothetical protein